MKSMGGNHTLRQTSRIPQTSATAANAAAQAAALARAKNEAKAALARQPVINVMSKPVVDKNTDPFRLVGMATVGIGLLYGVLWSLGSMMTSISPSDLDRFNAGKPVMLCTSGAYSTGDDTLLGRVFGDRQFNCKDWKMGQ